MLTLKLRKIGKSIGLVLPKEMLARLGAKEGDELFAVESPSGYAITSIPPRIQKQVEAGEAHMDRYQAVFAGLAKRKS